MAKTCTKTPVTERVVGGKLVEKVVRWVGNCKKGGSRLLPVAKKVSQSVVKKVVTLVFSQILRSRLWPLESSPQSRVAMRVARSVVLSMTYCRAVPPLRTQCN